MCTFEGFYSGIIADFRTKSPSLRDERHDDECLLDRCLGLQYHRWLKRASAFKAQRGLRRQYVGALQFFC
jgi:hypothetical protein